MENDGESLNDLILQPLFAHRLFVAGFLALGGGALVISNFTLCADTKKGNRPSFINAMAPEDANNMYEYFCERLKGEGVKSVEKGVFGGDMKVELLNNGPVTIIMDTAIWRKKC